MRGVLVVLTLTATLGGCAIGSTPPPDAQLIDVVIAGQDVQLGPPTANAGNVYFAMRGKEGGITVISSKPSAAATPGPLSASDIARIAHGDTQGTSIEAFSIGCSSDQRGLARGRTGPCGNVFGPIHMSAGKYLILAGDAGDPTGRPGVTMVVFEVAP